MIAEKHRAALSLQRRGAEWSLTGNGRALPIVDEALPLVRSLVANPSAAGDAAIGPVDGGRAVLASQFISFYFFDEGRLSKNVNYTRMLMPEPYHAINSTPEEVTFLVSNACNMKCLHCYNDSGKVAEGELSTEERLRVADYICRWGVRVVAITGGEPLVHKDTLPVMRMFAANRLLMKVSTNAWTLPDEVLELVRARSIFQFNVSLDGADPKTHDTYRKAEGSYERVMSTLTALRNAGLPLLNFNVTVYDGNLDQLDEICAIADRFEATSVSFKPVLMSGRQELRNMSLPMADGGAFLSLAGVRRFKELRTTLQQKYANARMVVEGLVNASALPDEENDPMDCGGGGKALFFASNGDLTPCELVTEHIDVPNARRDSPAEYWLTGRTMQGFRQMNVELRKVDAHGLSGCPAVFFKRKDQAAPSRAYLDSMEKNAP